MYFRPFVEVSKKVFFLVLSFYPTLRKACEIPNRRGAIFRFRGKSNKNIKKNIQFIERKYAFFIFFSKNTKITWKAQISTKDTAMRPKSCDFWLFCAKVFSFLIVFCYLYRTRDNYWCKNLTIHLFLSIKYHIFGKMCPVPLGIQNAKKTQKTTNFVQKRVLNTFWLLPALGKTPKCHIWTQRAVPLGGFNGFGAQSHPNGSISPH